MSKKIKILCLLPIVGDTKDSKRIRILHDAGFDVVAVAFERDSFRARMPESELHILAKIDNGNYLKRVLVMFTCVATLRKFIRNSDVIYAMNQDLAIFAYFSGMGLKKPLIIDVADIREIQTGKGLISRIFRIIDSFISLRASLIIVTAKGFITEYYRNTLKLEIKDFLLIENKVDYRNDLNEINSMSEPISNKIRIGYFGVLRDEWTILLFKKLVTLYPEKFEVICAGIDLLKNNDIESVCDNTLGMKYIGPYKSPDDLGYLFQKVDLIALFYPDMHTPDHWFKFKSICNSNRFYDACYFKKPMISFSFCEDGKRVQKYSIGILLDSYDIESNVAILNEKINLEQMNIWKKNLNGLDESIYCFGSETEMIKNKINNIIR